MGALPLHKTMELGVEMEHASQTWNDMGNPQKGSKSRKHVEKTY
jgi:hypothetical protein